MGQIDAGKQQYVFLKALFQPAYEYVTIEQYLHAYEKAINLSADGNLSTEERTRWDNVCEAIYMAATILFGMEWTNARSAMVAAQHEAKAKLEIVE